MSAYLPASTIPELAVAGGLVAEALGKVEGALVLPPGFVVPALPGQDSVRDAVDPAVGHWADPTQPQRFGWPQRRSRPLAPGRLTRRSARMIRLCAVSAGRASRRRCECFRHVSGCCGSVSRTLVEGRLAPARGGCEALLGHVNVLLANVVPKAPATELGSSDRSDGWSARCSVLRGPGGTLRRARSDPSTSAGTRRR